MFKAFLSRFETAVEAAFVLLFSVLVVLFMAAVAVMEITDEEVEGTAHQRQYFSLFTLSYHKSHTCGSYDTWMCREVGCKRH